MSDVKARFVGHPDGTYLPLVPVGTDGETRAITIPHGGELPTEIDGLPVPASFRDSLLEQKDNWTRVKRQAAERRARKPKPKPAAETVVAQVAEDRTTTAAKADNKED